MNKIKDMLTGHHAEKTGSSTTHSGTNDGLDIAQSEGKHAYESGNPNYAGQSGSGMNTSSGLGSSSTGLGSSTSGYDNSSTSGIGSAMNDTSRSNQYNDSIGTTGATSGSNFASSDPVSSGMTGNTGSGDIYNDRTGHTHPTTGQNTMNSDFQNDPTMAQTSSIGDAGAGGLGSSSGLADRSTMSGSGTSGGGLSGHLERDMAAYESTHHTSGGPHQTFTANRLDPRAEEEIPTFHEEHIHGRGVEHGRQGMSTEQYANEHYNPNQGPDFVGGLGSSTSGMGSSTTGMGSSTTGLGSSNTGYDNTTSSSGMGSTGHSGLGRDAAIGGAGLGAAAGLESAESRHHQSSTSGLGSGSSNRYDNTSTLGSSSSNTGTGGSVQDIVKEAVGHEHFGEQDPSRMNYRSGPGYGNGGKADTFSTSSGTGSGTTGNNM